MLATRSNVFASMLETELLENGNNLNVELEQNVAEEMVNYMYTGKVNLDSMASELLKPVNAYELEGLEKMCLDSLCLNYKRNTRLVIIIKLDCFFC